MISGMNLGMKPDWGQKKGRMARPEFREETLKSVMRQEVNSMSHCNINLAGAHRSSPGLIWINSVALCRTAQKRVGADGRACVGFAVRLFPCL